MNLGRLGDLGTKKPMPKHFLKKTYLFENWNTDIFFKINARRKRSAATVSKSFLFLFGIYKIETLMKKIF